MKRLNGWQGNALRVWSLMALLAMAVFFLTRAVLLAHSVVSSQQPLSGLMSALALGSLRDMPVVAMIAAPWALFELLFNAKWRSRLRWPLFALYVFTLLFVAISEGIFWDEFSVRFNFIALDYLVFTTEVIGNIRQSYPVGKIIATLLALTLLVVWLLRRPIQRAGVVESSRMGQLPWVAAMMLGFGALAYQQLAPEFSSNSFANELADNGWRTFLSAARQNRLDYRQFYASRPDAEVMADLQRLSGQGRIRVSRPPLQAVAYQTAHQPNRQPNRQPNVVVVMMESMSAEFMETFGNKQRITPNLDRLAKEGMLFANLYATGTRTVRGLEALSAALPPVKRL